MNTIERTEKIEAYLTGKMSDAEKKEFERLLLDPETSLEDRTKLQDEMELQKEIIHAIRRRGFREMVAKELEKIKAEEKEKEDADKVTFEPIKDENNRRKRATIWSLAGGGSVLALAAVMLLLFVVAPVARLMQDMSSQYVAQVEIGQLRGEEPDAYTLSNALSLMQANEWEQASQIVDDMYAQTANPQDEASISMHEDAEWLKAICLMHDGKVMKAKRLLRKIANSESPYSEMASEMLERTH